MDMSKKKYSNAVERVLWTTERTGPLRQPQAPIPDELVMQDGRRYSVRRLLEQVSHPHNITVGAPTIKKTGRPFGSTKAVGLKKSKYGARDYEFMAHATLAEIQQRYDIGLPYCRQLQRAAIDYIARHGYSDAN
jgi:hypothetical protein